MPGKLLLSLLYLSLFVNVQAQEKCAAVEIHQSKGKRSLILQTDEQFEQWISQRKVSKAGRLNAAGVYTIPVVVHVIHKNETPGNGVNISDAQIQSQIDVLNQDFIRTNPDVGSTPSEFTSVAGSMNIKFVLAKQDPDGLPTNGIVRIRGSKNVWSANDESALKAASYWPAEDYLNIWVTDLSSTLLGYAQFPVADIDGLESATDNRLTDGVVIDYSVFGSDDYGLFNLNSSFRKGRTTTHEVGHFFGLRHIWGDDNGSCLGSGDYVDDTPNQENNTSGCPSHPQTSCSVHTMFQNYMDYTNDDCMNLFTQGQIARMNAVIENSPRRASLLESHGAEDPAPAENDIALVAIQSPTTLSCDGKVTPVIKVVNQGINSISNIQVNILVNNLTSVSTIDFSSPIPAGDSAIVELQPAILSEGMNSIIVEILTVNRESDNRANDNRLEANTYFPFSEDVPFAEEFDLIPENWQSIETSSVKWSVVVAAKENGSNNALSLNYYNSSGVGEETAIFSPRFSFEDSAHPYLVFDVAYALSTATRSDALKIVVVIDCSDSYTTGLEIFNEAGSDLATSSNTSNAFTPSSDNDWKHVVIDLDQFRGQRKLRLALVGTNAGGNNVFIDNIKIVNDVEVDVSIAEIVNPSSVLCSASGNIVLKIVNNGSENLTGLKIRYTLNDNDFVSETFKNLNVSPADTIELQSDQLEFAMGRNELSVMALEPNGLFDVDTSYNSKNRVFIVDNATDIIPARQNFDDGLGKWISIDPAGGASWQLINTSFANSLYYARSPADSSASEWIVSPSFDFRSVSAASVFFDLYYGLGDPASNSRSNNVDELRVLVSVNCGESYDETVFSKEYISSGGRWVRNYIDLSAYAGNESIRLAWVASGAGLNNLFYLDNIEFFLSKDPDPLPVTLPYAVYDTGPTGPPEFKVTFNLEERQQVKYSFIEMTGKILYSGIFDDVLNQTFEIAPQVNSGIYVLRMQIGNSWYATKIYIDH